MRLVNEVESSIRWAPQPRFKLEATLLQMIKMDGSVQIRDLLQQINELKKKLDGKSDGDSNRISPLADKSAPASPTEVKVLGSVTAGPLKASSLVSAAAHYEDVQPVNSLPTASFKTVLQEPTGVLTAGVKERESIYKTSSEAVAQKWPDFVDDVRKTKIALGTTLSESEFLEANNGTVRIGCPDEYHFSSLKRNKEFLAESFQKATGLRVSIEPVIKAATHSKGNGNTPQLPKFATTSAEGKLANAANIENHPVITAIKRELGGELIR